MIKRVMLAIGLLAPGLTAPAGAGAQSTSLYDGSGPRPGPDLLYQAPAVAPELTNAPGSVWRAKPTLVSGTSAYRQGEFLWQSWLFDDHGAYGYPPNTDYGTDNGSIFSYASGTYQYPTDPAYAGDAADLVEFRVKPLASATAFRLTFNSMKDPSLVGTTIALGGQPGAPVPWPYGANVRAPADLFVTVHGSVANVMKADGTIVEANLPVSIDLQRRQIEVQIPHSDWNPGSGVVRMAGGVGLWDKANNRYLNPPTGSYNGTATTPGGGGLLANPPAFFKLLFRYEHATDPATGQPAANQEPEPVLTPQGEWVNPAFWRDAAQAQALAGGDIGGFYANVDFAKLAGGVTDDMYNRSDGVPTYGPMDRIYASHVETEQGRDYSHTCSSSVSCQGELRSQLQPYAIYIPRSRAPRSGYGLTLLLHSLTANYNQFQASNNQSQFANRAAPSIVITPEGRGPDGWYYDEAGADTFEVWADIASRYHLDPSYTDISGYSMGGYASYKFATQFPDLFAAGQPVVGPPALTAWFPPEPVTSDNTYNQLASLRNVPFLIWNASADELVPVAGPIAQANKFDSLGYRYELDLFAPAEHLTLATNDQFQPAADFLGSKRVDFNPPHVTYTYNPSMDFPADGTAAGHAYWVAWVAVRDNGANNGLATVDVLSHGFGVGDPVAGPTQHGADALTGGRLPAIAYTSQSRSWGPVPKTAVADQLDITATNVKVVTIDPVRARVDCAAHLNVNTDGPLTVTLTGCWTRSYA
jgi:Prolyl oligopeptidase family/C-terminal binding-module, SLH-like, of glucodextranase